MIFPLRASVAALGLALLTHLALAAPTRPNAADSPARAGFSAAPVAATAAQSAIPAAGAASATGASSTAQTHSAVVALPTPSAETLAANRTDDKASAERLEAALQPSFEGELRARLSELLGIRYRFGSKNPSQGLDCSGLVAHVWSSLGLPALPRSAAGIATQGTNISPSELRPGDLVFFNTRGKTFSHVGIYTGEGRFIHASSVLGEVVENHLSEQYYRLRFTGARRFTELLSSPIWNSNRKGSF
jgi:cell wall-associated NlpC family hydrolase